MSCSSGSAGFPPAAGPRPKSIPRSSPRGAAWPKRFHQAVEKWRDTYLPDFAYLMENWDRYFPRDDRFRLCAYRECGMPCSIECGEDQGKPKYTRACDMKPEAAQHLVSAIRAQASTEFGSIQQHQLTLARAQSEEDQIWVLRMMAEELRHGYQMLHLLLSEDWSSVSGGVTGEQMVEEILSMTTGSHVLDAFNLDYDSYTDNVVFAACIDRVGKYQLTMQKVCAYKPMADSMPPMLREEAFHLAAGVIPMRRWAQKAAKGDVFVTMKMMQHALNKWVPRGLEMFGDERGGGTNVRYGLKPMKNAEAQDQYYEEVKKVVADLNMRYVRARCPEMTHGEAEALLKAVLVEGQVVRGIRPEDLLRAPHKHFFRRRGVPAFQKIGADGTEFADLDSYLHHLAQVLPESYLAGRDFREYAEAARQVESGATTAEQAAGRMPELRRVGGVCPCSKSVRWVQDVPATAISPAAIS